MHRLCIQDTVVRVGHMAWTIVTLVPSYTCPSRSHVATVHTKLEGKRSAYSKCRCINRLLSGEAYQNTMYNCVEHMLIVFVIAQ